MNAACVLDHGDQRGEAVDGLLLCQAEMPLFPVRLARKGRATPASAPGCGRLVGVDMRERTCRIDSCDKQPPGRGNYCHDHRARRPIPKCQATDCDRNHYANGYCQMHRARLRRIGDPNYVPISRRSTAPTYDAIHQRLRVDRGPASNRSCVDCGGRADDWSYNNTAPDELVSAAASSLGLRYSADLADYEPRCKSCHKAFDVDDVCKYGHTFTPENTRITVSGTRRCRICLRDRRRERRAKYGWRA